MCHRITFCIDSALKHCAANRKRRLSALPNVGPYIYDVKIPGVTRSSIYIYDISRLMVKVFRLVTLYLWVSPQRFEESNASISVSSSPKPVVARLERVSSDIPMQHKHLRARLRYFY
jgi:hypothetical protein